jgi:hypothetical protein
MNNLQLNIVMILVLLISLACVLMPNKGEAIDKCMEITNYTRTQCVIKLNE